MSCSGDILNNLTFFNPISEVCTCKTYSFLLWRPSMGGESGGGLGKVNLTVYSLGLFSSSWAFWLSSSWLFFFPFCCFLVRTSLVCFSWMETNYVAMSTHTCKYFIICKLQPSRVQGESGYVLSQNRNVCVCVNLTACFVDLPPAFRSFSFFSCLSYCFCSSFCFWTYIFLNVTLNQRTNVKESKWNTAFVHLDYRLENIQKKSWKHVLKHGY